MSFVLPELASIITHAFDIPAIVMLWYRIDQYNVAFAIVCLMNLNSISFHFCKFTGEEACYFSFKTHQLLDHINAEGTVVLMWLIYARIRNQYQHNLILILSLVFLAYLKATWDTIWFTIGFVIITSPWVLQANLGFRPNPWWFTLFILTGIAGFICYFMDENYEVTHPLWHAFIFTSLDLGLYLFFQYPIPEKEYKKIRFANFPVKTIEL